MQNQNRTMQLHALLTEQEYKQLTQRAKRETGGNISELVRRALFPLPDPLDEALNSGDGVYRP